MELLGVARTEQTKKRGKFDMKFMIPAVAALLFFCGMANAATVTNKDGSAVTIVVTESGQQTEVGVGPGESVTICSGGCFVTMPNGDRETLAGGETVEISGGKATIK
jgi:seryl-tRNA(Sec) selenium transferase